MGAHFYERNNNGNVYLGRGPSVLYEVEAQNLAGVNLWLMVFDTAVLPSPGDVPLYSFRISDGTTFAFAPPAGPGLQGRSFPAGLFVTWCSAPAFVVDAGPFGESIIFAAGRDIP